MVHKYRIAAAILIFNSLWFFVPFGILNAAIDWPMSLDFSPADQMRAIFREASSVRFGYLSYLMYSILFFPLAVMAQTAVRENRLRSTLEELALGFAALSVIARCVGILRWLTVMPHLAKQWMEQPSTSIETTFSSINSLAGGIGELLGVAIFAGLWVIFWSADSLLRKTLPTIISGSGMVVGVVVMLPALELLDVNVSGIIAVSTTVHHVWWIALGVYFLNKRTTSDSYSIP